MGGAVALMAAVAGVAVWVGDDGDSEVSADAPIEPAGSALRWIALGGGATPETNEVSIEDDLLHVARVFGGDGVTFYAAGPQTRAVRVESAPTEERAKPTLEEELGALFAPRRGRYSQYRPTRIANSRPADPAALLSLLTTQVGASNTPLTVWLAGHGDQGERPQDNVIVTWANRAITPAQLADAVRAAKRRTRIVVTTCFSGGFAELAFDKADEAAGAVHGDVCGLFAATWDLEAGGCDPDPRRGVHDGYGVHFLNALGGQRADGTAIDPTVVDVDSDGQVSLLDAHTFARIASHSIDVPTTTSERWLRASAPKSPAVEPMVLAHEDAVIGTLAPAHGVATLDEAGLRARVTALSDEITAATQKEAAAMADENDAFADLSAELLGRWPVLDDRWHRQWQEQVDTNRDEIQRALTMSHAAKAMLDAAARVDAAGMERAALEVRRAPLLRVLRAFETKRLAAAMQAKGGDDWATFQKLRRCENSAP